MSKTGYKQPIVVSVEGDNALVPTNYVFVSKATGNDATATLNDKTKPYLTLKTASDYAYTQIVAGKHTVVRVLDGVYDENRLNPAQAYYEFDNDTYVLSSTGGNYPIFGDTDGTDRILSVSGKGTFIKLNYHPGNDRQALCFSRAGSNIFKFEAKEIDGVQLYGTYNKPLVLANMYHRFRVDHHDNQTITFNNVWFKTHLQLASFKGKLTTLRFNDCTVEVKALHSDLYPIYNNAGTLIGSCADSYGVNSVDTSVLTQQQVVDTETLSICRNIAGIDFAQVVNTDTFNVIISNMRLIIYKTNCIGVKVTQRVEKAAGQTQNFRIEGLKIEDRTAGLTVIPYSATKTNTLTTDYRISLIDATINDKEFVNIATTNASYLDVEVETSSSVENTDFAENWSGDLNSTSKNSIYNLISGSSTFSDTIVLNKIGGEPVVHDQTTPINFIADTANSIVGCWKMIKLNTNTYVVNFGAGFIKMSDDITPSTANYIWFYFDGTNIQVFIKTAGNFVYNDPITSLPVATLYLTGFESDKVDQTTDFVWIDKVSEGVQTYSQSNASFKPTYANPYLTLSRGDYLVPAVNQVMSNKNFFVCFVAEAKWSGDFVVIGHPAVVGLSMRLWYRSGKIIIQWGGGTSYEFTSLPAASSSKKIITLYGRSNNLYLRINGVLNAHVLANGWTPGNFDGTEIIGDDLTLTTKGFVGDIGAIVMGNGTNTDGDLETVENELSAKFAIAI